MAYNWKKQASVAYGYSLTRLALNYYMYAENIMENPADLRFESMMACYLEGGNPLDDIKELREQIQNEMEIIMAYIDGFCVYESALNRVERRFETDSPVIDMEDGAFVERLLYFLTSADDSAVMNHRIQMIVEQLPIRFTRQKFYSMVSEALSIYIGSDQSGLERIMYLLRTAATVGLTEEQKKEYPKLYERIKTMEQISFRTMDATSFADARAVMKNSGEYLNLLSDAHQTLQDMVNDLYVLCLTRQEAMRNEQEEVSATSILRGTHSFLKENSSEEKGLPDSITDELYLLEGLQESYDEKYQRLDPPPAFCEAEGSGAALGRMVDKLLSASSFASMEEVKVQKVVEKEDVETAVSQFAQQLDPVFTVSEKPVVRAIMAAVLSRLPICFHSIDDISQYMINSLNSCTDMAEKETCMELLLELMEIEDGILV